MDGMREAEKQPSCGSYLLPNILFILSILSILPALFDPLCVLARSGRSSQHLRKRCTHARQFALDARGCADGAECRNALSGWATPSSTRTR
jgi:hypothetical protein